MTPDERNMISDLANKLAQTPAPPRDPEAEDFIRTRIGSRPDALYLMTQTVLIQNMALQQAQRQISELQQRGGSSVSPVSGGSFLGGRAGAVSSAPAQQQYAQPSYAQPSQPSFAQSAGSTAGGPPSFLRSAAQTAAGVAAGTLAVQGIESLFHGFGGGGGSSLGGLGGGFGGFEGGRPDETIVNNYYDNPGGGNPGDNDNFALGDNRDNFADTNDIADSNDYSDAGLSDDSSFGGSGDDFS